MDDKGKPTAEDWRKLARAKVEGNPAHLWMPKDATVMPDPAGAFAWVEVWIRVKAGE